MAELRPRSMTQGEFAELLREKGFTACSKAAVSLAERSKESGVQFTPAARNAARGLLNSTRRAENRTNPNKTTVWLDDETRIWLEERAYMEDSSVGALIRKIVAEARKQSEWRKHLENEIKQYTDGYMDFLYGSAKDTRKAAPEMAVSEAAGE